MVWKGVNAEAKGAAGPQPHRREMREFVSDALDMNLCVDVF